MKKQEIKDLIDTGRELEFTYNNKKYSITYGRVDGKEVISFCEFNQESTEVATLDELLAIQIHGISVGEMLQALSAEDLWIF